MMKTKASCGVSLSTKNRMGISGMMPFVRESRVGLWERMGWA